MRHLLVFAFALLLALPAAAQKYNVPLSAAPAGFHWQMLPEVKGAMLLPDGWYYKPEGQKGVDAYFLTQEEIVEGGEFQTGMSLNVVRKVKDKTGRKATEYAQAFSARSGTGAQQQVLERQASVSGPFHTFQVRYRATPPGGEPKIISQWAVANAKSDSFYLFVFESPEKDWEAAWKEGALMWQEAVLDSGI